MKILHFLKLIFLFTGIFLIFFGEAMCESGGPAERMRGRDIVQVGEFITVAGTLKAEGGEWLLVSEGVVYEIHLGDHQHRRETGIELEEGKEAVVAGFFYAQEGHANIDIAVCTIEIDEEKYRFRSDTGTPLWRGRGQRSGHNKDL